MYRFGVLGRGCLGSWGVVGMDLDRLAGGTRNFAFWTDGCVYV